MSLDTLFSKLRASLLLVMSCCFVGIGTERARGQYDPTAPEPIEKLRGSILLHGGGPLQRELREKFSELAGGKKARIVVIPTADPDDPLGDEHLDLWREWNPESLLRLHAASPDEALRADFCQPLGDATGVWFSGGRQSRLAQIYLDSPIEAALQAVLRRGGVVGGSSAGAAIATQVMLVRGEIRTGMDLLPGAIVDQHFVVRGRSDRLLAAVAAARQRVGFGIDEGTALLVQGRRIEAIGESSVTICLPGALNRPPSIRELKAGQTADYVALTRAARARGAGTLPLAQPPPPIVEHGTLVIVGGGGMPKGLLERFVELSGGPDAPIVYVPCEEQEMLPAEPGFVNALRNAGAKHVSWIHTKDRRQANQDEQFLEPLKEARGIWFGGGRQWNLVDSYQHTTAHQRIHEVLKRGGAIGGSSAGASIQGDYMPRGDPLGNLNIIAEGYEQGLGFLTGVAIDQHFAQRNRFSDMSQLIGAYPQLLGIGIDESTGIVVRKQIAEVVGRGNVAFYDSRRSREVDEKDYVSLSAGESYDLVSRCVWSGQ